MKFVGKGADGKGRGYSETHLIAPEILAVITAAATAMLGPNLRIASVAFEHKHNASTSRWTRQGRSSIQTSHNLRTNRQPRGSAGR
jgi:hypothetical protein